MHTLEFFFDCSSPWTYLAFESVQKLKSRVAFDIEWRPILVGGVFNKVNPSVYENRAHPVPAKAQYYQKDLRDWARYVGISIGAPPVFPVNSVKAMRGCILLEAEDKLVPFAQAVFEAYWTHDRDISQDAVLAELCARVGADAQRFFAGIATPEIKAALKANTEEVIARGGFGSPTIFVGDDMYFGNDRLGLVREAVLRERRQK